MRDLVEELTPYIKECLDRRQEKLRRMRKRDLVRLAIVRIFELMAEQRSLGKRLLDTFKKPSSTSTTIGASQLSPGSSSSHQSSSLKHLHQSIAQQHLVDEQQLRKTFIEYMEGMPFFLDQELASAGSSSSTSDSKHQQSDLIVLTRLHFSLFIHKLVDSVQPKEKRALLLPESMRFALFCLCDKWAGRFSLMQHNQMMTSSTIPANITNTGVINSSGSTSNPTSSTSPSTQVRSSHLYMHANHHHHHNCYHYYDELELAAARACGSILCAGNTLDYMSSRTSIVYTWLTQLLEHANIEMRMYDICKCALPNEIYMLSMNLCVQLLDLTLHHHIQQQTATTTPTTTTATPVSPPPPINFATSFSPLFEWILHKCFAGVSVECADLCFIALARVYIDYLGTLASNGRPPVKNSFDHAYLAPLLVLSLVNIGSARINIHETSVALLKSINKAFLQENYSSVFSGSDVPVTNASKTSEVVVETIEGEGNVSKSSTMSSISSKSNLLVKTSSLDTNQVQAPIQQQQQQQQQRSNVTSNFLLSTAIDIDIINSMVVHPQAQLYISEHMARKNPELTMFVIAEITSRLEQCSSHQGILWFQIKKNAFKII